MESKGGKNVLTWISIIRISDSYTESPETFAVAESNHTDDYSSCFPFAQIKVKIFFYPEKNVEIYWSLVLGNVLWVINFKSVKRRGLCHSLHFKK